MIEYQEELISDLVDELKPLLEEHWQELAVNKEERPLDVDWDNYINLNNLGLMKIYTARKEGELVGYATFVVTTNLHYRTWKCATCDVYFVNPLYRKSGVGTEFFKEIVEWLRTYNVHSIYVHDKLSKSHSKLFTALGFKAIEQTYEMVL